MRAALLVSFFLFSLSAFATDPELPFCEAQINQQVKRWVKKPVWRLAASETGTLLYLAPTERLGQWLDLSVSSERVLLRRVSLEQKQLFGYFPKACHAKCSVSVPRYHASRMAKAFTDETLRNLVRRHRAGIIYAWSPGMPLSIERVDSIRQAGKILQLPIFFVLDPHADRSLAEMTAFEYGLTTGDSRPMESLELFNRGMLQHYPSILVFSRGQIRGPLVPGWKHASTYVSWVQEILME